jgi:hypothetical protein
VAWPVAPAIVAMVANRPASAYSVRSMIARVREQLRDRPALRGVAVRDRAGGGGLGDERDLVAEVGCEPRRGLASR